MTGPGFALLVYLSGRTSSAHVDTLAVWTSDHDTWFEEPRVDQPIDARASNEECLNYAQLSCVRVKT